MDLPAALSHMSHIDLKKYRFCDVCNKLVDRSNWARHVKFHKTLVNKRCGHCPSTFRRKDNYVAHLKKKHPGKVLRCCNTTMDPAQYASHAWNHGTSPSIDAGVDGAGQASAGASETEDSAPTAPSGPPTNDASHNSSFESVIDAGDQENDPPASHNTSSGDVVDAGNKENDPSTSHNSSSEDVVDEPLPAQASTSQRTPPIQPMPDEVLVGPAGIAIVDNGDPLYEWYHEPKLHIPRAIWDDICEHVPTQAQAIMHRNWEYVRTYVNERDPVVFQYNYRLLGSDQMDARDYFRWLYTRLARRGEVFKIKGSLQMLLQHKTKAALFKFFYASNNNYNLPLRGADSDENGSPFCLVKNEVDKLKVMDGLSPLTLNEFAQLAPSDTKWNVSRIVGCHFWVCPLPNAPIGAPVELPEYLKKKPYLSNYQYDKSRNYYDDNLCTFRFVVDCLQDCDGTPPQEDVLLRFNEFLKKKDMTSTVQSFKGIEMEDVDILEDLFNIRIQIYSMNEAGLVRLLRMSMEDPKNPRPLFYAHLYISEDNRNHLSRITDLQKFSKTFFCEYCQKVFKRNGNLLQHIKKGWCSRGQTKYTFPGGKYEAKKSIATLLNEIGIKIEDVLFHNPFLATYDLESLLRPLQDGVERPTAVTPQELALQEQLHALNLNVTTSEDGDSTKLQLMNVHVPLTFSICSNVPGYEEPFIETNPNTKELISTFVDYLEKVSTKANALLNEKYAPQIQELDALHKEAEKVFKANEKKREERWKKEQEEMQPAIGTKKKKKRKWGGTPDKIWLNKLRNLKQKFKIWRSQLVVIGFNSAWYDLPLIREFLYPKLVENARANAPKVRKMKSFDERMLRKLKLHVKFNVEGQDIPPEEEVDEEEEEDTEQDIENRSIAFNNIPTLIKQGSGIMCLSTTTLKFLDLCKYLAPGTSLDKFLKAWEKNDMVLLEQKKEVPFGVIKSTKIPFPYTFLDSVEKLKHVGVPDKSDFKNNLRLEQISEEDYQKIVKLYDEKGFKNFQDYLHYYVMLDTVPLLQAIQKMFYLMLDLTEVDMFREALSLPGLTLTYLARKTPNFDFSLFGQYDEHLHNDLKSGITGGLSVVNTRLAEVGKTFIRGDPKHIPQDIMGLDFNAMYLATFGKPMPTGYYTHFELVEHGRHGPYLKKKTTNTPEASVWLEYLRKTLPPKHQNIVHAKRNGYEKRCGPRQFPCDGVDELNKIVYEYTGCFWHCHCPTKCTKNFHFKNPRTKRTVKQCADELKERTEYLESLGYTVIIKWECHWLAEKKDAAVQNVLKTLTTKIFVEKWCVSHDSMMAAIMNDTMFGFVKVDIHTPDHLKDFFEDFPPIIKHTTISIDDVGKYMQDWCIAHDEMKRPRKCLIGSYFGKEVWLLSPVLKYLVHKGLVVTKIHDVLQYEKEVTFEWFRDKVTQARKDGDKHPELAIIGEMEKLKGNSAYGKTITALHRHKMVGLIGKEYASAAVTDPFLYHIEPIGEAYEVTLRPRKKEMNLPIQIGLAVYQYSKLYMMEFAWDVLGKYCDKSKYEWMESDTDSIYLMIEGQTLDDLVYPEKKDEWDRIKGKYLVINEEEDKRTPGLLKVEYKGGQVMVCLRAKMYAIQGKDSCKLSSSGLMKRTNDLTIDQYRRVLETGEVGAGINVGFMKKNNTITTYVQQRDALNNCYVKRRLLDCGIRSVPLDL